MGIKVNGWAHSSIDEMDFSEYNLPGFHSLFPDPKNRVFPRSISMSDPSNPAASLASDTTPGQSDGAEVTEPGLAQSSDDLKAAVGSEEGDGSHDDSIPDPGGSVAAPEPLQA